MTTELRLHTEGLDWREVDGRIVALLPGDGGEIVLNRTGAVLWRLLADGAEADRLRDRLVENFGIDPAAADRDVAAFVTELRRRHLLEG
jgi:Coenzyme PQQ synthesis protein D (PqqD)